jgi:Uma2 family endonuclease
MSTASTPVDVKYPESDGKPMGETDLHIHWTIRLRDMLKHRYRGQRVYVSGNLLVYYVEGNPRKFVVPDAFVVTNCDPGERRVYKIWDEPAPPEFIIEVTSLGSRREDTVTKPRIYGSIGVREYFVYDPTCDYLNPPLRGFRRADDGQFVALDSDADGWLVSAHLGLRLRLEDGRLVLQDVATGEELLTEAESERRLRGRERAALQAERTAREAAEAELERLREQLRQNGPDT